MSPDTDRLYRGAPSARRVEERRARLLAAAFTIYARDGFEHMTVRSVCAEAGLTPRYFYESFGNRATLILATFDAAIDTLDGILRAAVARAAPDPDARLRAVLTAYFQRLRDDAAVARVFLADMHGVDPAIDARFRSALHRFGASFAEIMPKLDDFPSILRDGLAGGLNQIALTWIQADYEPPLETVVETALLLFAALR